MFNLFRKITIPFILWHEDGRRACNQPSNFREGGTQDHEFLLLSCVLKIPLFNESAEYELFMEIRPAENSNLPFKLFQGIYKLKENFIQEFTEIKYSIQGDINESYKGTLGEDKEVDIFRDNVFQKEGREHEIHDILDAPKDKNSHFFIPGLKGGSNEFKYATIKSGSDCHLNDNGVTRTVVFYGKICLKDALLEKPYPNEKFRVFIDKPMEDDKKSCVKAIKFKDTEFERTERFCLEEVFTRDKATDEITSHTTDENGCIHITVPLFNKIYVRQKYIRVPIYILSEKLGLYASVEPALNPWQKQFQAYVDATKLDDKNIRFTTRTVKKPRLIINQFKSVNMFPSYGLDKFLNIHLYHRLYFFISSLYTKIR